MTNDKNDVDVFFFFNPFGRSVMQKVLENVKESINRKHRTIYVIYVNPQFFDCFIHENFEIIYELRSKKYSEAMILRLN